MRIVSLLLIGLLAAIVAPSGAAVSPEKVTLTWDKNPTPGLKFHFRLQHFAHPEWIDLGLADPSAGQLVYPFTPALPNEPASDRWICVDGQGVAADGTKGKWFSEVNGSAACNQVDVGEIIVPPPPPSPPSPPPAEQCQDMRDNDGDGKIDYPADPGCTDPLDNDEADPVPPPPPPNGLFISSATPDEVVITATVANCPRIATSTTGSTKTVLKRTVRCLR